MPAPTRTFSCGPDYQPVDVAFGSDGALYSTDANLTDSDLYRLQSNRGPSPEAVLHGAVSRHTGSRCVPLALGWTWPFGTAALPDGRVCVSHSVACSANFPHAHVSCWDGEAWRPFNSSFREAWGHWGSLARGLAAARDGLVVALSLVIRLGPAAGQSLDAASTTAPFPSPGAGGLGTLVHVTKDQVTVVEKPPLLSSLVHFVAVSKDGTAFASLFAGEVTVPAADGAAVVRVDGDGAVQQLAPKERFEIPSGLAIAGDGLWVADYARGALQKLDFDGNVESTYTGLHGPMGVQQAPNGDLCIAEMLAGRTACLPSPTPPPTAAAPRTPGSPAGPDR